MNKKHFTYLLCSIGFLNAFGSNLTQAILTPIGLEDYNRYGKKLTKLADSILSQDGYNVNWKPIGAGRNGAVFKATNKEGNKVAIKLSFSDTSSIRMVRSSSWKPHTRMSQWYYYLGELELSRRWGNLMNYYSAIVNKLTHVKKYREVILGPGLPKIHALYRFLELDYDGSHDWSIVTVMDWVDGEDLEIYSENNKFDDSTILDWTLKILKSLKPLHNAGWYHRDLNASNIMRKSDGSLVVIDLGKAIDYYDKNKNTVPPWHNPDLIANRDNDPDLAEIYKLINEQLYKSKGYVRNNKNLHDKIVSSLDESDNCQTLYEKLSKLK